MAVQRNNYFFKAKTRLITSETVADNPKVSDSRVSSDPDTLFIQPNIKLKLYHKSGNLVKYKPNEPLRIYTFSRDMLKSDDIMDTTSRSWISISNMISDIQSNFLFKLDKVCKKDEKINLPAGGLVRTVLGAAQSMADTCSSSGMHLSITQEAVLNHDTFVSWVFGIDRQMRIRDIMEKCLSRVQVETLVDVEAVKREIMASFGDWCMLNEITEKELEAMTKVLAGVGVRV